MLLRAVAVLRSSIGRVCRSHPKRQAPVATQVGLADEACVAVDFLAFQEGEQHLGGTDLMGGNAVQVAVEQDQVGVLAHAQAAGAVIAPGGMGGVGDYGFDRKALGAQLQAVYPSTRRATRKIAAFIEHLRSYLSGDGRGRSRMRGGTFFP